jgi:hypothetical protein
MVLSRLYRTECNEVWWHRWQTDRKLVRARLGNADTEWRHHDSRALKPIVDVTIHIAARRARRTDDDIRVPNGSPEPRGKRPGRPDSLEGRVVEWNGVMNHHDRPETRDGLDRFHQVLGQIRVTDIIRHCPGRQVISQHLSESLVDCASDGGPTQ